MRFETQTQYENDNTVVTVIAEKDKDNKYQFIKHIKSKLTEEKEIVVRYSLETFLAEHKIIEQLIQTSLIEDRHFYKQVLNLKVSKL